MDMDGPAARQARVLRRRSPAWGVGAAARGVGGDSGGDSGGDGGARAQKRRRRRGAAAGTGSPAAAAAAPARLAVATGAAAAAMRALWEEDELVDVELVADVDGRGAPPRVRAHRLVLAAHSRFFRALFAPGRWSHAGAAVRGREGGGKGEGGEVEDGEGGCGLRRVRMGGVCPAALRAVVAALYTGALELCECGEGAGASVAAPCACGGASLQHALEAADQLGLTAVHEALAAYMQSALCPEGSLATLALCDAHGLGASELAREACALALRSFSRATEAEGADDALGELELERVLAMLGADDLEAFSEQRVLDVAQRWVAHDAAARACKLPMLLRAVRLELLPAAALTDIAAMVERGEGVYGALAEAEHTECARIVSSALEETLSNSLSGALALLADKFEGAAGGTRAGAAGSSARDAVGVGSAAGDGGGGEGEGAAADAGAASDSAGDGGASPTSEAARGGSARISCEAECRPDSLARGAARLRSFSESAAASTRPRLVASTGLMVFGGWSSATSLAPSGEVLRARVKRNAYVHDRSSDSDCDWDSDATPACYHGAMFADSDESDEERLFELADDTHVDTAGRAPSPPHTPAHHAGVVSGGESGSGSDVTPHTRARARARAHGGRRWRSSRQGERSRAWRREEEWCETPPAAIQRACAGAIALDGGFVAIFGGSHDAGGLGSLSSAELYDSRNVTCAWSLLPDMTCARSRLGAARAGRSALAVGGYDPVTRVFHGHAEMLSPPSARGRWERLPFELAEARASLGAAVVADCALYAVGGSSARGELSSVEVLDLASDRGWLSAPELSVARVGAAVAASDVACATGGGRIFAAGGACGLPHPTASVDVLDPREGRWLALPPMSVGRLGAAAACLGNDVFVAGGVGAEGYLATVEVYDACAGRWRSAPDMCAPRSGACAVAIL